MFDCRPRVWLTWNMASGVWDRIDRLLLEVDIAENLLVVNFSTAYRVTAISLVWEEHFVEAHKRYTEGTKSNENGKSEHVPDTSKGMVTFRKTGERAGPSSLRTFSSYAFDQRFITSRPSPSRTFKDEHNRILSPRPLLSSPE